MPSPTQFSLFSRVSQITTPSFASFVLRYDWTVGLKQPGNCYPGQGFFSGGSSENCQPVGLSTQGIFTVPAMDPTVKAPLPDNSEYYFYVRAWLADKRFKIFRSDGVRIRASGPKLKPFPRVLDGQNVRNVDYWNGSVAVPSNVSVHAFVDNEYQPYATAVEATWSWFGLNGWGGLFLDTDLVSGLLSVQERFQAVPFLFVRLLFFVCSLE